MLKYESKDSLLARVWHRDTVYSLNLLYYESVVYSHIDGSVLLRFSYSGFALILFCSCALSLSLSVSHS
jgi:hypothetical protein